MLASLTVRWADSEELQGSGTVKLHNKFAKDFYDDKDYPRAEQHYLLGSDTEGLNDLLCDWSSGAPKSEHDLFITRTVLR